MRFNADLSEENDRLRKENSKLLGQLADIQSDIEKTMNKLPSIEEFVATKQENDQMRSVLARHVDALQNSAVEKEVCWFNIYLCHCRQVLFKDH